MKAPCILCGAKVELRKGTETRAVERYGSDGEPYQTDALFSCWFVHCTKCDYSEYAYMHPDAEVSA